MKKIYQNKKALSYKNINLLWDFLFYSILAPISVLIMHINTWSTIESTDFIYTFVLFILLFIIHNIIFAYRKHLLSIYIDTDNNTLIINQLRRFKKNSCTVLDINKLKISKLQIGWYIFFELDDTTQKITISSSNYGISEEKVNKLYQKIQKKINPITTKSLII